MDLYNEASKELEEIEDENNAEQEGVIDFSTLNDMFGDIPDFESISCKSCSFQKECQLSRIVNGMSIKRGTGNILNSFYCSIHPDLPQKD